MKIKKKGLMHSTTANTSSFHGDSRQSTGDTLCSEIAKHQLASVFMPKWTHVRHCRKLNGMQNRWRCLRAHSDNRKTPILANRIQSAVMVLGAVRIGSFCSTFTPLTTIATTRNYLRFRAEDAICCREIYGCLAKFTRFHESCTRQN